MIIESTIELPYKFDVGRPSYFEHKHFETWTKFFDFVEHSPIQIAVNGQYFAMKDYCDQRQNYGGGGYGFVFWFLTKQDRRQFVSELEKIFGPASRALDWRHVMLVRELDGNFCLRFRNVYLPQVEEFVRDNPEMCIDTSERMMVKGALVKLLELRKILDNCFLELEE